MVTIVAATLNKNKVREIEAITGGFGFRVITRGEAGVPDIDIIEDGETFEENSLIKAREIMRLCGMAAVADDSGIAVDALGGAPGIFSARYAGEECDDKKNRDKLLAALLGVPYEKRTARFVSVISLVRPDGKEIVARGESEGHIIFEERGENGFGYDSLFVPLGYDKTYAELSPEEKNKISHRARALSLLKVKIEEQNVG
jgi:XTP/dITP diphosphohydrolase